MTITLQAAKQTRRHRTARVVVRLAAGVGLFVIIFAIVGPFIAPYPPSALVGVPFSPPSAEFPLGTDALGRDALSRVMHGGWQLISIAVIGTAISYALGGVAGLIAGYEHGSWVSTVIMRSVDLLLSLPPLLIVLVVIAATGPNLPVIMVVIGIFGAPSVTRVIFAACIGLMSNGYVEAAIARGQGRLSVLRREILPNLLGVISADLGPRFGYSLLLLAGLGFLGVGAQPPSPDWALSISENLLSLSFQPQLVLLPALLIAALSVSANIVGDRLARGSEAASMGRS